MITLTSAELLAMRACIEVAEPSPDDSGPMEIWATAMGAMKKIEDVVQANSVKIPTDAELNTLREKQLETTIRDYDDD